MKIHFLLLVFLIAISCTSPSSQPEILPDQNQAQMSDTSISVKAAPSLLREITTAIDNARFDSSPVKLVSTGINLSNESFELRIPEDWKMRVAAQGLKRLRFMAMSPDKRLFITDMYNLTDNRKGRVYIFDHFDEKTGRFDTLITYLDHLRNPNSVQFYTDENGKHWLYLALTDKLLRYPYSPGDNHPHSEAEVLATFPDYGLSYKYGGWHLTRTIAIHNDKLYISVGSSCNVCEEKEEVRASVLEMNMDGSEPKYFARGVRNAVGMKWVGNSLFSSNMGVDHLGNDKPEEALYVLDRGRHYGWPYYYQYRNKVYADTSFEWHQDTLMAEDIPLAWSPLGGHTAPLGFAYFGGNHWPASVRNYFLVALHGSGKVSLGKGYEVIRTRKDRKPEPVIAGFLQNGERKGRPCDLLIYNDHSFFLTDDHKGVLYFVETE